MLRKLMTITCLLVASGLLHAPPAMAGGWAVVTLDELPHGAVAREPLTVGFMIRQHGQTAWVYDDVKVRAFNNHAGQSLIVLARPEGVAGHYVATLTFPAAGSWNWSIASGLWPDNQPMPVLEVRESRAAPLPVVVWTGDIRLGVTRQAARLGLTPADVNPSRQGQELFLAKGCIVCHTHRAIAEQRQGFDDMQIGPNLTHLSADSDFLHRWLKDPSAIKPGTYMPTLGLSDSEIDSLVAFLLPAAADQR